MRRDGGRAVVATTQAGPRPGDCIARRFVLERAAGTGSAGAVFRAFDLETRRRVALKLFHVAWQVRPERSLQEARALAAVNHPAIVGYIAHGCSEDGVSYLAMRWIDGETLAARLARRGLSPLESLRLAKRLGEGLAALHACGIVHRDLKPSNILLEGGSVERACIVDLGVSRDLTVPVPLLREGAYVGTPRYMAPEQIRAPHNVQGYSDVFALGCILYECLCGAPAFDATEVVAVLAQILFEAGPSPRTKRPELPAELDGLLAGMLARRPALRPIPGPALTAQLDAAMSGLPGLALMRLGPPERVAGTVGTDVTASSGVFER